jgi:hypothetical protein
MIRLSPKRFEVLLGQDIRSPDKGGHRIVSSSNKQITKSPNPQKYLQSIYCIKINISYLCTRNFKHIYNVLNNREKARDLREVRKV